MQVIVLAAGMGKRLKDKTKNNTKCMVEIHGKPMIAHSFDILTRKQYGIKRIVMVVGYYGDKVKKYLGSRYNGVPIEYIDNPIYDKTNNIYSLALAKEKLLEDDTLLLESDLVFQCLAITSLLECPYPDIMLATPVTKFQDQYYVEVDNEGVLTRCSTDKDELTVYGEMVGIHKIGNVFYKEMCEDYARKVEASPKLGYELELEDISRSRRSLHVLKVDDLKWYEIDDPADLAYAEEHILPFL